MTQLNWDCSSIMSRQVSFHMYAMQPGFACRRKQLLRFVCMLDFPTVTPANIYGAEGQCGLGYSQLLPASPGPSSTSPSSLPFVAPTAGAATAAQSAEKRRNFLIHAEPQEHRLPGLPGSHWHGIDAEDERTGMSLGLEKKWSFCDYFCSDPSFSLPVWLLFKISLHVDFWGYCSFHCHMKSLWGSLTDGC